MPVDNMLVSADARDKLGGRDGVAAVAASLWPADCQTCGQPLGSQPPALCVDDLAEFAYASLHHPRCRAPGWNDSAVLAGASRALVSHRTRLLMLPLTTSDGGEREPLPVMVINPALEAVFLAPGPDDRWHPEPAQAFAAAGLVPPGPGLGLREPIRGARARLTTTTVTITMTAAPFETYTCDLAPQDGSFRLQIARQRGIMMAVSQTVDPASDDLPSQFRDALTGGALLSGWVALDDDGEPAPDGRP